MEIDRDGIVHIPPQDVGTYRDYRISVSERLERLALLLGGDQRLLLQEAANLLQRHRDVGLHRQAAMDQYAQQINGQRLEIARLRAENQTLWDDANDLREVISDLDEMVRERGFSWV